MKKTFNIKKYFSFGWNIFKQNALFLIILFLVTSSLSLSPVLISHFWKPQGILSLLYSLINMLLSVLVSLVWTNVALTLAKGNKIDISDILKPLPRFLPFWAGNILYSLIMFAGVILLIFPAIIWALKFMFYTYAIVENKGAIEGLKKSSQLTYGYKWKLLGFAILAILLNIAGLLCFGIGLLITAPVTSIAIARIYVDLKENDKAHTL